MSISAKKHAKRKEIVEAARYLAATSGGELEDWIEGLTPHGKPFTDEGITQIGYKLVATHTYTNPNGVVLFQVLRYHHELVPKEKRLLIRRPGSFLNLRRTDPRHVSEWVFGQPVKVIYRWHEIVRRPDDVVELCEGEADADRMEEFGFLATTVAGQNWSETAAEALKGREVRIWEHNDAVGRENTEAAIEMLSPVAKSVKVVRLPGLAHRGDVSDWLNAGHTKEDLITVAEAAPATGIRLLRGSDLPSEPRPRAWAIPNRVPSSNVTLLSGPGGGGKSMITLQQCVASTLGKEHMGVVPTRGKTLFMDAEEDVNEIHHRLHAIGGLFDCADYRALINSGDLNICSLVELGAVMAAPAKSGRIEPTALYGKFLEMCGDIKPVLTVVANSANVFAGNENDRGQVQQFVDMLRRGAINSGGGLILISHPSLTGIATKSGLSGSTQWHNAVRARMVLSGVERDDYDGSEPTNDMRVMKFHKNNYGPISDQIVLRWKSGLFVPVINTTPDQAERHQQAEQKYMEVLHLLTGQGQDLSANKKAGNTYAVAMIFKHPLAKDFLEAEMEAAQQRLLDADKIHILEEGPPTRRRKRIMPGPRPEEAM